MIQEITYHEFINKAASDKDINFIAFLITPWHAISLDASIKYLESIGIRLHGMVLISPHENTGVCVNESSFLKESYDLYIEKRSITKTKSSEILSQQQNAFSLFIQRRKKHLRYYDYIFRGGKNIANLLEMYVIQPVNPDPFLGLRLKQYGRHARFVLSDEGVGTYTPYYDTQPPQGKMITNIHAWQKYFREVIVGHRLMQFFHSTTYTMIFKKEHLSLVPRKEVIPFYRDVISQHVSSELWNKEVDLSNSVVIAPSVHMEEIESYHNEDVQVWKEVCAILDSMNLKIFMKPHPRDKFFRQFVSEWKCELIDIDGVSMEELCAKSCPKCIIGFASTALVTANMFYDIPVVCINELMNPALCSEQVQKSVAYYKKLFSKIVSFPQNAKEFNQLLMRFTTKKIPTQNKLSGKYSY